MVDDHILPDEYDNDDGLFQRRPRSLVVVSKEGKKLLLPIIPHHWSKHTWKDTKWNYSLASSCMTSIHIYQNVKKELNFIMSEVMRHCCWVSTGVVGRGEIRTFRVLKSAMWYSYYKHYLLMKCSFPYGKKIKKWKQTLCTTECTRVSLLTPQILIISLPECTTHDVLALSSQW